MGVRILYFVSNQALTLDIDATLSFTETLTAQATEHPIEDGSVISDNVIAKPKTLKIEGVITDTPLGLTQSGLVRAGLASAASLAPGGAFVVAGATAFMGAVMPPGERLSTTPKEILRTIHATRAPISVMDGTGLVQGANTAETVHDNMILETLELPRDSQTGESVKFTGSLKQIITVTSETVKISSGKGKVSGGKQPAMTPPKAIEDKGTTAFQLGHSFGLW